MGSAAQSRMVRSIVLVATYLVIAKALGAGREILLAAKFGTGEVMDAYLFVWNLANWPISVWLSTLTVVAVPLLVQSKVGPPGSSERFLRELALLSFAIGAGLAAVLVLTVYATPTMAPALFPPGTTRELTSIALPMSLLLPAGLVIGVFAARCISLERHTSTLAEGVPALVVILFVVGFQDTGSASLIWGTVIGFIAHAVALAYIIPRTNLKIARTAGQSRSQLWAPFRSGFWAIVVGQLILSGTSVIDQFVAAHLGPGAISELGYANRVLALVIGLGTTAVARATLPVLSALQSSSEIGRVAQWFAGLLFVIGAVAIVPLWLISPWIVGLLFERGAFGPRETEAVSDILKAGFLQIPFYFTSLIAVQALAARGQHNRILQIALLNVAVKVAGNLLFVQAYGPAGIMLGTAMMYASATVQAWYFVVRVERQ